MSTNKPKKPKKVATTPSSSDIDNPSSPPDRNRSSAGNGSSEDLVSPSTYMQGDSVTGATFGVILKRMDLDVRRQIVFAAVGQNVEHFLKAFNVGCEVMWLRSMLKLLNHPETLQNAGYTASDVTKIVQDKGWVLDKETIAKATEIDRSFGFLTPPDPIESSEYLDPYDLTSYLDKFDTQR